MKKGKKGIALRYLLDNKQDMLRQVLIFTKSHTKKHHFKNDICPIFELNLIIINILPRSDPMFD